MSAVLAATLARPAALQAAPPADPVALAVQAQRVFQLARSTSVRDPQGAARRYAAAGDLYGKAAAALPEQAANRETRADLLGQAGSAYLEAHRLAPADPTPLRAARALTRVHLDALVASYGPAALATVEHERAAALAREVDGLLGEPAPGPARAIEEVLPAPTRDPPAARRRADWRRVGLGTSLALAGVSIGATLGMGLAVSREPFSGVLYRNIRAAAQVHGVPNGAGDDMCAGGREMGAEAVIDACDTRDRVWRASVAMAIVSGVLVASAITFGVLLARSRRMQRRGAGLAVMPAGGGLFVAAGARF